MANEHSIRVSAKGEFGQLTRGLKQLQNDFKGVLGEVDKGARKGGIFDESSLRALNVYRQRFKSSLEDLNNEFKKQNQIIDRLHDKMRNAQRSERDDIQKNINLRERNLDVIRKQLYETERLYKKRMDEASAYERAEARGSQQASRGTSYGGGGMPFGGVGGGMLSRAMGIGRFGLGLAGVGGVMSMAQQAYQGAYMARTTPMDLAQRIRGQGGWRGDSYNMWNRGYGIGTKDRMGYTAEESWGFQDQFSRMAGTLNGNQMGHLLKFGRAYGLNTSEVAQGVGGIRELGGVTDPSHFADMIAKSVGTSGMTPRILEVMQTSAGLLSQMNTSLKDTGAKQILAYQTTLDTLGQKNGMMKLTGKGGADIISGLGGIYDPQATDWKYMGMQALQRYDPKKYGNMGLYGLESTFEDGLLNDDNLPAMTNYLKEKSGGNTMVMKRMLQKWLQAGGYNATKTQVDQLYDVTDGFSAFDKDKMQKVQQTLDSGDGTENYQNRVTEIGQGILDVNARYEKQLEELGQPLLEAVTGMKEDFTEILEWMTDNSKLEDIIQNLSDFIQDNWKTLVTVGVIGALGALLLKGIIGLGGFFIKGMGGLTKALVGRNLIDKADSDIFGDPDGNGKKKGKGKGKVSDSGLPNTRSGRAKGGMWGKLGKGAGIIGAGILGGLGIQAFSESQHQGKWDDYIAEMEKQGVSRADIENSGIAKGSFRTQDANYVQWHAKRLSQGKAVPDISSSKQKEVDKYMKQNGLKAGKSGGDLEAYTGVNSKFLAKKGVENLENLKVSGASSFEELMKAGDDEFTSLFETGDVNFTDLFETGAKNFGKLYKEGTGFLASVFKEHEGFKDYFGGLWSNFASQLSAGVGGLFNSGNGLSGSLSAGSNYDVRNNSGVTASQLNSQLGGALKGKGQQFIEAGAKYGMDPAFLASIAMHETGNGTSNAIRSKNNVGGMMGKNGLMSFGSVNSGIDAMASNLKRLYIDQGLTTVEQIQKKYAPNGAKNDPTGLNKHWVGGVYKYMNGFGATSGGMAGSGGNNGSSSIWGNWQKKVTSEFGSTSGRNKPHSGLDIDGNQGDFLDAVASGKVVSITRDPNNKTAGGNSVKIQLSNGQSYSYAHLSRINPNLKVGSTVKAGDWIGDMGGDKGKSGSGYSTTGSHLHLSTFDKSGKRTNPRTFLNSLTRKPGGGGSMIDMGDDYDPSTDGGYQMSAMDGGLASALGGYVGGGGSGGGRVSTVNVTVKLEGDADKLNSVTDSKLKRMIRDAIVAYERQRLSVNPTVRRGY